MVCCNAIAAKLTAMIVKTTLVYRSVVMVVSFVSGHCFKWFVERSWGFPAQVYASRRCFTGNHIVD